MENVKAIRAEIEAIKVDIECAELRKAEAENAVRSSFKNEDIIFNSEMVEIYRKNIREYKADLVHYENELKEAIKNA